MGDSKNPYFSLMFIAEDVRLSIESLFSSMPPTMGDALGIEFTWLAKDTVKARMPVDHRTHQPMGLLHGGASVALAETVASVGAWLNVHESGKTAVGLEINANHLRAVRSGWVVAVATPIHKGTTTHVWSVEIRTEDQKLVCVSRCTLAVISRPGS